MRGSPVKNDLLQIRMTPAQIEDLAARAAEAQFDSVSAYVRAVLFPPARPRLDGEHLR